MEKMMPYKLCDSEIQYNGISENENQQKKASQIFIGSNYKMEYRLRNKMGDNVLWAGLKSREKTIIDRQKKSWNKTNQDTNLFEEKIILIPWRILLK